MPNEEKSLALAASLAPPGWTDVKVTGSEWKAGEWQSPKNYTLNMITPQGFNARASIHREKFPQNCGVDILHGLFTTLSAKIAYPKPGYTESQKEFAEFYYTPNSRDVTPEALGLLVELGTTMLKIAEWLSVVGAGVYTTVDNSTYPLNQQKLNELILASAGWTPAILGGNPVHINVTKSITLWRKVFYDTVEAKALREAEGGPGSKAKRPIKSKDSSTSGSGVK